ncbi:MAG: Fe-S-containing hydro-lyase [Peptococcaceae bacterium]|jgi:fumarate hydratase subunit beta|nr:Fe-S-containing hydro-lyase [Peptococcaceae bacterium]
MPDLYKRVSMPLTDEQIENLSSGEKVLISGIIYSARDTVHKRLTNLLAEGKELPVNLKGQTIYYVGPTPAKPGQVCGSAGPTTSSRMDVYTPQLLDYGLKGMIGKGKRSEAVIEAMIRNKAVYFAATGGAAAVIAKSIKAVEMIAYEDLGAEALQKMTVVDFPAIVVIDCKGHNLYQTGPRKYAL